MYTKAISLDISIYLSKKFTFQAGKYPSAVKFYDQVVTFLESEGELEGDQKTKRDALLLAAYLNIAMCKIKLEEFLKAISNCDKALALDPQNEKGLFRRGQVRSMPGLRLILIL